jgi:hypothetical protein
MAGKRKFLMEEMEEWTDYELEFVQLCIERKWIVDNEDGTGCPVLYPARKKKRKTYSVSAHGRDEAGNILMSLCITSKHGRTKNALLRKAKKASLEGSVLTESETDSIYLFPIYRLPRAVKTFNLRKKQRHPGPPASAIKKGQKALEKWRKTKNDRDSS